MPCTDRINNADSICGRILHPGQPFRRTFGHNPWHALAAFVGHHEVAAGCGAYRQNVTEMKKLLLATTIVTTVAAGAFLTVLRTGSSERAEDRGTGEATRAGEAVPLAGSVAEAGGSPSSTPALPPVYTPNPAIIESSTPIPERIHEFRDRARKDQSAALDLARTIALCSAATSDEEVDELLEGDLSSARAAEYQHAINESCSGISDDDFLLALELADQAAASGLPEAMVEYENIGAQVLSRDAFALDGKRILDYQNKATGYLARAAQLGNPNAMYRLSVLYTDGHLVPRDPHRALEYYRAYLKTSGNNSRLALENLAALEEAASAANNGNRP